MVVEILSRSALMGLKGEIIRLRPPSGFSPITLAAMVTIIESYGMRVSVGGMPTVQSVASMTEALKLKRMAEAEARIKEVR